MMPVNLIALQPGSGVETDVQPSLSSFFVANASTEKLAASVVFMAKQKSWGVILMVPYRKLLTSKVGILDG